MDQARLEDVLWLAVKTPKPPMTGALTLQTVMILPPGDVDVVEKLQLDGKFTIEKTRFTDPGIQKQDRRSQPAQPRHRVDGSRPRR